METLARELVAIVDGAAVELRALDDARASARPSPAVWSVKEIIGHLVDSASNNHQRFVRAQLDGGVVLPGYEQDGWARVQSHDTHDWPELVTFWQLYNHHLAHVIRHVAPGSLGVDCVIGGEPAMTLGALIEDYVRHLRHHLAQARTRWPT